LPTSRRCCPPRRAGTPRRNTGAAPRPSWRPPGRSGPNSPDFCPSTRPCRSGCGPARGAGCCRSYVRRSYVRRSYVHGSTGARAITVANRKRRSVASLHAASTENDPFSNLCNDIPAPHPDVLVRCVNPRSFRMGWGAADFLVARGTNIACSPMSTALECLPPTSGRSSGRDDRGRTLRRRRDAAAARDRRVT